MSTTTYDAIIQQLQPSALLTHWKHAKHLLHLHKWWLVPSLVISALLAKRIAKKWVSNNTVLEVTLNDQVVVIDTPVDPMLKALTPKKMALRDLVDAIDIAAKDSRVTGMVAKLGSLGLGFAHAQELRDAIKRFKKAGKKTFAYAESFSGNPLVMFYLACAFDEIYIPKIGHALVNGIMINHPFLIQMLNKLGIQPEGNARKAYKNAKNLFFEEKFTKEHREVLESIMNDLLGQLTRDIAEDRKVPETAVNNLLKDGPHTSQTMFDRKFVDGLVFQDQLYDEIIHTKLGLKSKDHYNLLYIDVYLSKVGRPKRSLLSRSTSVAVVTAEGNIFRGSSKPVYNGGPTIGSDTTALELRAAADDKNIKAIIFRVNSGGGDAVASDLILREIHRAKEKGKKVVVSMGNVAGSGGYWISMYADRIIAEPLTITGSIGVFIFKFVMRDMFNKLGITFDDITSHESATTLSGVHNMTPAQKEKVEELLDFFYNQFVENVAKGRNMSVEEVEKVAQGRIWTGYQAKANGLVDDLGGMDKAVEHVKELLGLKPTDKVILQTVPKDLSVLELVMKKPPKSSRQLKPSRLNIAEVFSPLRSAFAMLSILTNIVSPIMAPLKTLLHTTSPSGGVQAIADNPL